MFLQTYLLYISTNGSLAIALSAVEGWSPFSERCKLWQFVAGTDSRSLSIAQIPDNNSTRIILIYQNSDGLMMIMEMQSPGVDTLCDWQNLTSKIHSSIPSIMPRSRFSSLYWDSFEIFFYDKESNTQTAAQYWHGDFDGGEFSSTYSKF